jgi:hypothetical protein
VAAACDVVAEDPDDPQPAAMSATARAAGTARKRGRCGTFESVQAHLTSGAGAVIFVLDATIAHTLDSGATGFCGDHPDRRCLHVKIL